MPNSTCATKSGIDRFIVFPSNDVWLLTSEPSAASPEPSAAKTTPSAETAEPASPGRPGLAILL